MHSVCRHPSIEQHPCKTLFQAIRTCSPMASERAATHSHAGGVDRSSVAEACSSGRLPRQSLQLPLQKHAIAPGLHI